MLAPATLPDHYRAWNARHGAPFGAAWWRQVCSTPGGSHVWKRRFRFPAALMRAIGPFGFQANNSTRVYEYPWVYEAIGPAPGMKVVDVGSGASGLPFVLANEGVEVTAVDPLPEVPGADQWVFTQRDYARLNRAFGNTVRYIPKFLEQAGLPAGGFDRVVCISVIEHVDPGVVPPLMQEVHRLLRPGGVFITTIDLFIDCAPFTDRPTNQWGSNMDVRRLVECSGLTLATGTESELCGYPSFDPAAILARKERLLIGGPALTQLVVLRKDR